MTFVLPAPDTRPLPVRAVMVAAPASGQGKTSVTAALARRCVRAGQRVRVFKTGPDFLDPLLLAEACGSTVRTLDLWMVGELRCKTLLAQAMAEADVVLIEGVMGLYDGTPSAADLARACGVPVLLVLDVSAMAQTAGAIAQGLRDHGPVPLAGVIANRVASPNHLDLVARSLRDIALLGHLPRQAHSLPERHLGLVPPAELPQLGGLLDALADSLVLALPAWEGVASTPVWTPPPAEPQAPALAGRLIAVARDAAFAFCYPANLELLVAMGAEVRFFSPLQDEPVPAQADAVYLPGGYPELHAEALSAAGQWRASVRHAHARGVPIVAECGGMMAVADALTDAEGRSWPMAGLLPGGTRLQKRLVALGPQAWDTPQGELRGQTYHYSVLDTPLAPSAQTRKHPSGLPGEGVYRQGSLTASYFHAYFPSCPAAVAALFTGENA
jgi:cobyrinic acid a,c-diamide synthase